MSVYCEHLCEMIRKGVKAEDYERPLKGLKIVVDAGNGVGGFYAERVSPPRSGHNRQPLFGAGRYVPESYSESRKRDGDELRARQTLGAKADLGVIFDTDVDRGGRVSSDGREINRNALVALVRSLRSKTIRAAPLSPIP